MSESPINFRVLMMTTSSTPLVSSSSSRFLWFLPLTSVPLRRQSGRLKLRHCVGYTVSATQMPYHGTVNRNRRSATTAAVLGIALWLSACGGSSSDDTTAAEGTATTRAVATTTEGSSPDTTTSDSAAAWPHDWIEQTVGGGQFNAGDYEGQDLVLWFWAPW